MKFFLRDRNVEMAEAWQAEFADAPDVDVSHGDIFDVSADAIVSPANSFGFMDGGIDLVYSRRFGWALQARLQELLRAGHDGELPVGQAVVVATNDPAIPWLISAPTMRVPMDVSVTVNAYLAFRAAIRTVRQHNLTSARIETVLCPGLGTAVGRMPRKVCARQMRRAYETSHLGQVWNPESLLQVNDVHHRMVRP
jgi:O-acetyl-ADP-ribose deacetylase (regulator of RNase III)